MKTDAFGVSYSDTNELCDLLYKDPTLNVSHIPVTDAEQFNTSVDRLWAEFNKLKQYTANTELSVLEFDKANQANWFMPDTYKDMDIAKWLLDQCTCDTELQRVGEELLLYVDRDLLPILCYMKYMVDTLRKHDIVWGVGRGSSVASFVLYLIGVHKINSITYKLDIHEFLR